MTPTQAEVLEFIKTFIAKHRYSPTYREIADACGTTAPTAHKAVKKLVRAGFVSTGRQHRGLRVRRRGHAHAALTAAVDTLKVCRPHVPEPIVERIDDVILMAEKP